MMNKILKIILIISLIGLQNGFCQKKPIDTSAYAKFTQFAFGNGAKLSNDGKYAVIRVSKTQLITTDAARHIELHPSGEIYFTQAIDAAFYLDTKRKVHKIRLRDFNDAVVDSASAMKLAGSKHSEWLILEQTKPVPFLRLVNLANHHQQTLPFKNYVVNPTGNKLLVLFTEGSTESIRLQDLVSGKGQIIWKGKNAANLNFDASGNRCFFSVEASSTDKRSVWYFQQGYLQAEEMINAATLTAKNLELQNIESMNASGDYLFLTVRALSNVNLSPPKVSFKVWSYDDSRLPTNQEDPQFPVIQLAAIQVATKQFIPITGKNDFWASYPPVTGPIITFTSQKSGHCTNEEQRWNKTGLMTFKMFDMRSKKIDSLISSNGICCANPSPDGHFVAYYNADDTSYHCFDLVAKTDQVIARSINWSDNEDESPIPGPRYVGGWYQGSRRVILYDEYDIWAVDPKGELQPINLTNGYGRLHHLIFRPALENEQNNLILQAGNSLILSAFNRDTKENGYFRISIGSGKDPEKLYMGTYLFEMPIGVSQLPPGPYPIKANAAQAFLVKRQAENDPPNYFFTKDFRTFVRLTNEQPQKENIWLTTELVNWQLPDGRKTQGILYKPENFDPAKKYPVIFYYYEKLADQLHAFLYPDWSRGRLDIPTYVSNGYLVFTPDIHYKTGKAMQSALETMESAAKVLASRPYIDSTRFGLQGHSFGGIQTDFIVTHSHLFAAACSASAISNWTSEYGGLIGETVSHEDLFESGQLRVGTTLWDRPDLYVRNSAIFNVNHVTTPLLIMHTDQDIACSFSDAVQFFTGLRRMGKKAWMLEYDGNNHILGNPEHARDFTIRMQQFFDHYLKGAPAPKWMVKPGSTSLELEPAGVQPGPNLLTQQEQAKADSLLKRPPFTLSANQ